MWLFIGLALIGLFYWMWRLASRIERKALEEKRWIDHINEVKQYDPVGAYELWAEFERKFL